MSIAVALQTGPDIHRHTVSQTTKSTGIIDGASTHPAVNFTVTQFCVIVGGIDISE